MLMFALFTLWKARTHLRQVVRKAFTGDPRIDDGRRDHLLPRRRILHQ